MLNSIQALRAIAAWTVVFHHYMQVAYSFTLTDPLSVALHQYGAIGVDLFFVISGFVIYLSAAGKSITPLEFAKHRLARIVPAYWIFTSLTALLLIYLPGVIPLSLFEPSFFIKSLFFIPAANPSGIGLFPVLTVGWTLNYEMAFYTIFFASLFLPQRLRIVSLFLGVIALSTVLPKLGGLFEFYNSKMIYEFLLGVAIGIGYNKGMFKLIRYWHAFGLLAVALYLIISYGQVSHHPLKSGLPCALIVVGALALEPLMKKRKVLNALGNWSYSTYLCHIPILSVMVAVQKTTGIPPLVTLAGSIALIVLVSALSFLLVERPIAQRVKKRPGLQADSAALDR